MQHSSTPSMDTMPTVISIDPPHSRDLDDAVSVVKDADGWTVDVCVPDVPSLVHPGDPLDERAMRRVMKRYVGSIIKEPMIQD
jgi:exoribonuclease R